MIRIVAVFVCFLVVITIKTLQRLLIGLKNDEFPIRINATDEDLRRKEHLIRTSHGYLIRLLIIEFSLN